MRLIFALFLAPGLALSQPLENLVKEIIASELRHFQTLQEYTAEYEWTRRQFGTDGKLTSEDASAGESYMSHKQNIDIALTLNGKPLKPKDLDKQQQRAKNRLITHAAERISNPPPATLADDHRGPGTTFADVHTSSLDVLRLCKLSGPRQEGRSLAIEFSECRKPIWKEGFHYPHLRGTVWIDPGTKLVQSWKAWVIDGPKAGALFYETETQLAPGGGRVIGFNHTNFTAAPHVFPKLRVETIYRWKNPQRFEVNVDQTIGRPKQ